MSTSRSILDANDPKTAPVLDRLRTERAAWLTTVNPEGIPQSSPIWFIWDDGTIYLYSKHSPRVRNVRSNPGVSLNLDGNRRGGEVVVLEGTAEIEETAPGVPENQEYLAKYGPVMEERGWSPEWFGGQYPVFIRITPTRIRHW